MARVKFSGLVTEIRGSVGGTTFQSNAYGWTIKNKANMIRPNSQLQQLPKTIMARVTSGWSALTVAQRATIDSWAAIYPQYSKHNPDSILSGFAVWVRYWLVMLTSDPSTALVPFVSPLAPPTIDSMTVHGSLIADVLSLDATFVIGDASWYLAYGLTPPLRATNNTPGSLVRLTARTLSENDDLTANVSYINQFGR
ncbi:MAG: hypothetical protein WC297_03565, partial [Candidatus Paceibacterota bacterium]